MSDQDDEVRNVESLLIRFRIPHPHDAVRVRAFLGMHPHLVTSLGRLPQRVSQLWGAEAASTLTLYVSDDHEDDTAALVAAFRPPAVNPTEDAARLLKLSAWRYADEGPWPSGIGYTVAIDPTL